MAMEEDILDLDWCDESVKEVGIRVLVDKIMLKSNLNKNTVRSMIFKAWNLQKGGEDY